MNKSEKSPAAALALSGFVGWIAQTSAFAIYVFLFRHQPGFAPEIGPLGSFLFFATIISAYYVVAFVLVGIPAFLLAGQMLRTLSLLPRCLVGGVLFGLGGGALSQLRGDGVFYAALAFIGGFVMFMVSFPANSRT